MGSTRYRIGVSTRLFPRRIAVAWLVGLLCAVAAGIVGIALVNAYVYGPEQQIRNYMQALRAGNGEAALGILHADIPEGNPAMLDGKALEASVDGLDDVSIGDPETVSDDRVEVPVGYTLDGRQASTTFTLERTGTNWLFFDTWAFVPATLPSLDVSIVNEDRAKLNGELVALPQGKGTFPVLYPGSYTSHYQGQYFTAAKTGAAVTDASDGNLIALATQPTDKLRSTVSDDIDHYLDACAEQNRLGPTDCPFFHYTNDEIVGDITWKITDYPNISIEAYDGRWVIKPLKGTAVLTSKEMDLFSGAVHPLRAEHDFKFKATLDVSGKSVTVTPQVSY